MSASAETLKYPTLHLQFLVIILSLTAILGKEVSVASIPLVFWRSAISAIVLVLISLLFFKRANILPKAFTLSVFTGFILAAHWITFFMAIKLSNVSVCLAGMTCSALFTSVTEAIFDKRSPKRSELILGAAIIPGLLIMMSGIHAADIQGTKGYIEGFCVALISAFLAAIFPVLNKKIVSQGDSPRSITMLEMFAAAAFCIAAGYLTNAPIEQDLPIPADWIWIGILSLLCTVFAFCYHIFLLKHLSAFTTNLAINFEPVYGIILAAILYKEHQDLSLSFFLGTCVIITVNIIHSKIERRSKKQLKTNA